MPNQAAGAVGFASQGPFESHETRYLNIYSASELVAAMPNGAVINSIALRLDEEVMDSFTAQIPDLEIRMSTSPSLAPVFPFPWRFSDYVGKDETIVFRGPFEAALQGSGSGPNPFEIIFPLQNPFTYDPRNGSLAVDFMTHGETPGHVIRIDAGGRALGSTLGGALFGATQDDLAINRVPELVLHVQFTPVPEPATLTLTLMAVTAWILRLRISHIVKRPRHFFWHLRFYALITIVLRLCLCPIDADTMVVPKESANSEGFSGNFPFSASIGGRFLNIYSADELLTVMPNGGEIHSIAFRLDGAVNEAFVASIPDVELRLSTSPSLAPVFTFPWRFSNYVGKDEATVFRGSFEGTLNGSGSGPNPFDIVFRLQTPFVYDPRNGGLAVDIISHVLAPGRQIVVDAGGRSLGSTLSGALYGSANDDLAINRFPEHVIQLGFTPIPEPGTCAFFAFGLIILVVRFSVWKKL